MSKNWNGTCFRKALLMCLDDVHRYSPRDSSGRKSIPKRDLARFIPVGNGTVSQWLRGSMTPIENHWERLLVAFPSLSTSSRPSSAVMDKPGPTVYVVARPLPGYFTRASAFYGL